MKIKPSLSVKLNDTARVVSIKEVQAINTPQGTDTWKPVPHHCVAEEVIDRIFDEGLVISAAMHSLSHEGMRYFGLLEVRSRAYNSDHSWVIGILNSHDQKHSTELISGIRCYSNNTVVFSSEISVTKRHTRDVMEKLPGLIDEAIRELHNHWSVQDERIETYKATTISDAVAHDLVIKALDRNIISTRDIERLLRFYRRPNADNLRPRTAWSLFNAFASVLNVRGARKLIQASLGLLKLFDAATNFKFQGTMFVQTDLIRDVVEKPLVNEKQPFFAKKIA